MENSKVIQKRIALSLFVLIAATAYVAYFRSRSGKMPQQQSPELNDHLLSGQDAVSRALPLAQEWAADAKLAYTASVPGKTGASGHSNDWELYFVSSGKKGRGFHIILSDTLVLKSEEIPYIGKGGTVPVNLIPSEEAVNYIHTLKGYETEPVISTELFWDATAHAWRWAIKTARGTTSISAEK